MNLPNFSGKNVLLLQGPVGPFFWNLAKDLKHKNAKVFKFNFNAGDWFFFPSGAQSFKGNLTEWPAKLEAFIYSQKIDVVLLFGDCRPVHACVRKLAKKICFAIGVFEEGYIRPDFVTFESVGVNGNSAFPKQWSSSLKATSLKPSKTTYIKSDDVVCIQPVGNTFWHAAAWGMIYFFSSWMGQWAWNNSLHHRKMSVFDAPFWWLSFGRKFWYKIKEGDIGNILNRDLKNNYFLIPLQVHNDSQISMHSNFESICDFIDYTLRSFSKAIDDEKNGRHPQNGESIATAALVFKHHPMDRGHRNYGQVIQILMHRYGLSGRVFYIHDQHLPSLLKSARGVVVVNSTVGLSALGHGAPVKVCGIALYDIPGITFQGRLRHFWHMARSSVPDVEELNRFKKTLITQTQINGSFYKKLPRIPWQSGVALDGEIELRLWGTTTPNTRNILDDQAANNIILHAVLNPHQAPKNEMRNFAKSSQNRTMEMTEF